jgi:hypothetical protein
MIDKKAFAKEFERTIALGKAKAYSSISIERPLTKEELSEYKKQMQILGIN